MFRVKFLYFSRRGRGEFDGLKFLANDGKHVTVLKNESQSSEEKVEIKDLQKVSVLYGSDQVEDIRFIGRSSAVLAQVSVSYKSSNFVE